MGMNSALHGIRTARFVGTTYRTVQRMQARRLPPDVAGRMIAKDCSAMGPLYVKLAQFVSSRGDGLDPDFANALSVVQDDLPTEQQPSPPTLPGFQVLDKIASASIADVFRGRRLLDDRAVAIKQRRPRVKERVETDLPVLSSIMLAAAACNVPGSRNMYEMIRESEPMVLSELDFRREAASAVEFSQLFQDVPWLRVPRVLAAGEDVLVTEFVASRKLSEVVSPNPALAQRLMDLYMMMLSQGLVHADPHPGNIGILEGGDVVLYDFGAMLRVGSDVSGRVAQLLHAGLTKDADTVVATLEGLGVLDIKPGQRVSVRRVVRRALEGNVHEELSNSKEFAGGADERAVRFGATFVYLTRTLTLIEGACRRLDPDFRYDYQQWVEAPNVADSLVSMARTAASVPSTMLAMQSDMELFQARILGEIDEGKAFAARAFGAAAVASVLVACGVVKGS